MHARLLRAGQHIGRVASLRTAARSQNENNAERQPALKCLLQQRSFALYSEKQYGLFRVSDYLRTFLWESLLLEVYFIKTSFAH